MAVSKRTTAVTSFILLGFILLMLFKYQTILMTTTNKSTITSAINSEPLPTTTTTTTTDQLQKDYATALANIRILNATIDIINKGQEREQNRLQQQVQELKARLPTADASNDDDICHFLPPGSSAQSIWMSHLSQLLQHSIHPYDEERHFVDLHAQLLHLLSTERLDRSVQGRGDWSAVQSVMEITRRRQLAMDEWRNNNNNATTTALLNETTLPPKLNILVMGGSVAEGDKCEAKVRGTVHPQRRRHCAWPFRLQFLLDRILGGGVAHVTTATVGGTNSEAALVLLEYDLMDVPLGRVDVLIHAYATNDMHAYTQESATKRNVTLRDRVLDLTEQFVRKALTGRGRQSCSSSSNNKRPLVMYLDDYIGNEQDVLIDTAVITQTIPFLANYYGFHYTSYADAVRDLVYGDTQETFLSPYWKIMNESTGELYREVHPGMGAHVAMAFTMLYNMLHLTVTHCQNRYDQQEAERWRGSPSGKDKSTYSYNTMGGLLPELNMSFPLHKYYKVAKEPPKGSLPPPLYPNLTLSVVSRAWKEQSDAETRREEDCTDEQPHYENRCIFAWVSRITKNCMLPRHLDHVIAAHAIRNDGWASQYEHKKLGLVPVLGPMKSMLVLQFPNLTQPISSIMMTVMKSYGTKWEDSKIRVRASSSSDSVIDDDDDSKWKNRPLSMEDFTGHHGKNTSEQYAYTSKLLDGPVAVGDHFRISVQLVDGNASKIMGMAVCSN